MKILTYTNLFPNSGDPAHGIFVKRRLRELTRVSDVDASVVAPVPWFPFRSSRFGARAAMARIPERDVIDGFDVSYPRYPLIPKIGMNVAPFLMAVGTRSTVAQAIARQGGASLMDAHYFYPDGVAASSIASGLGLPLLISARGSDVNLIAQYAWPRRLMRQAAGRAGALIAVSSALADSMADMGMPEEKIHVIPNGVDLDFFCPGEEEGRRRSSEPRFLYVGSLKRPKGQALALEFLAELGSGELVIAGKGPDEAYYKMLADRLGVRDRVRFLGSLDPVALRSEYRSADVLMLMSEREGMPNVLLESLACGTPVIASRVGGTAEIVGSDVAGELVDRPSVESLLDAWRALSARGVDTAVVRRYAMRFSWDESVSRLLNLMQRTVRSFQGKAGIQSHKTT